MEQKLEQQYHPALELDNGEPDVILVWQHDQRESQVIFIEREKVDEFITLLQANKERKQ